MIKFLLCLSILLLPLNVSSNYFLTKKYTVVDKDDMVIVTTTKVAHITGEINFFSYGQFAREMYYTSTIVGPRLIIIQSPGGAVVQGQMMLDLIKKEQAKNIKVYCYVRQQASSMAFNILSHCDVRISEKQATFLVHKQYLLYMLPPSADTHFNAKYLKKLAKELEIADEPYRRKNAEQLKCTLEEYDLIADNETTFTARTLHDMEYLHSIGKLKNK